jgi:hypothetical protein
MGLARPSLPATREEVTRHRPFPSPDHMHRALGVADDAAGWRRTGENPSKVPPHGSPSAGIRVMTRTLATCGPALEPIESGSADLAEGVSA